jgi:serine acetyltransferase/thymidylate kinase
MENSSALAGALFRFLNDERIEYCVLGIAATECIELVVAAGTLERLPGVLRAFGARNELELIDHRIGVDGTERYRLACISREQRPEFISIEVRSDYLRCGHVIFTAEELLRDRVAAVGLSGHGRDYSLATPAKEFLCHLLRCIDAGIITERDGKHLSEQWSLDAHGVATQIERFWHPEREGGVVVRAAASGNWEAVQAALGPLQSALHFRNLIPPMPWLREEINRLRTWWQPGGLLIACLGPQGSGKGSVISALREQPLELFRTVHTMELRPGVMRARTTKAGGETTRSREPRGRLSTIAKFMMFVADYWLGYWLRIRPRLVRSTLVVSNRYFDDVLVDPRRYRIDRALAFARILLRWIPRPELWLVFDIPSEALQARQVELGAEEATRQRGEYRRLLKGHENVVVLDADQPLERVVAQAQCAIAAQVARRTARRLGLPVDTVSNRAATKTLLFFCRRNIPLLSRFVRILFNSDIQSRLPPDVHLPHPYGIVVHPQAVIGRRVTVMQQVTIGGRDHRENIAPIIGDDVYIGAGARVLGDVRIGQGVVIGANAVVTRDIPPGVTVVGANRIVPTPRTPQANGGSSVTQFPIGVQRSSHTSNG